MNTLPYLYVVQGTGLKPESLEYISHTLRSTGARKADAWRFRAADSDHLPALQAYCASQQIDIACVRAGQHLRDFRLLTMDMDSTLITIECIDEIADFCGKKAEVSAITEAAMRGEIKDFNESLQRRVALLAGVDARNLEAVYNERLQLSPGAENLLQGVRAAGLKTLLVSGGFTFFTERLRVRLALDYVHANTLEIVDGKLTGRVLGKIVNDQIKAEAVQQTCTYLGTSTTQAIVMGDGSNDLKMMALAGLSVAFRAKPIVRAKATQALDYTGLDGLLAWFD